MIGRARGERPVWDRAFVLLVSVLAAFAFLGVPAPALAQTPPPVPGVFSLEVDARDAPRRILHARLVVPARPGHFALVYPKWIPGDHGPSGPIGDLAGLRIEAEGRSIPWERDSTDWYTFRFVVPGGTDQVVASYDFLWPASADGPQDSGVSPKLAILDWYTVALAPEGADMREVRYAPTLRAPEGWTSATALGLTSAPGSGAGSLLSFETVTLERLLDSPVLLGAHMKEIVLAPGVLPPHRIVLAADGPAALEVSPALERACHRLVTESLALFGTAHYRSYTFLVPLSDGITHYGVEHHESSVNRMPEKTLLDAGSRVVNVTVLSHEIVHSWNGKYRRPADMVRSDFQTPIATSLLWVYEGLTEYYGWVLAGRSGLIEPADARDELAYVAAAQANRTGRRWRSLRDTAVSAHLLYFAPGAWAGWRRGSDYYGEGLLLWLEVDALIREKSRDRKSLDDFARAFLGGAASGPPEVVPYRLEDVITALNSVEPHDWAAFFAQRVDELRERPPLEGIERAGWKLAYGDSLTPYLEAIESETELLDLRSSIGIRVSDEGAVSDVLPDSPAYEAGLGPGMKLVAVNGRKMSGEMLREALEKTKDGDPLELLVENGEFFRTVPVSYRGGERQPFLERQKGTKDRLQAILKPRAKAPNVNGLKSLR